MKTLKLFENEKLALIAGCVGNTPEEMYYKLIDKKKGTIELHSEKTLQELNIRIALILSRKLEDTKFIYNLFNEKYVKILEILEPINIKGLPYYDTKENYIKRYQELDFMMNMSRYAPIRERVVTLYKMDKFINYTFFLLYTFKRK